MTHPINSPSPGGPGREVTPLTEQARRDKYLAQTGGRLTARQARRIRHKANRAAVRSA